MSYRKLKLSVPHTHTQTVHTQQIFIITHSDHVIAVRLNSVSHIIYTNRRSIPKRVLLSYTPLARTQHTHTHEQQIGNRHIRCTDGIDNLPKAPSFQFKNIINEIIINWKSIINSWNCKCNDKARSTCLCTSTRARAAHSAHSKGALTKAWLHHHLIVNRKRTQAHFYVWQYINEIELKAKKKNSRKK